MDEWEVDEWRVDGLTNFNLFREALIAHFKLHMVP